MSWWRKALLCTAARYTCTSDVEMEVKDWCHLPLTLVSSKSQLIVGVLLWFNVVQPIVTFQQHPTHGSVCRRCTTLSGWLCNNTKTGQKLLMNCVMHCCLVSMLFVYLSAGNKLCIFKLCLPFLSWNTNSRSHLAGLNPRQSDFRGIYRKIPFPDTP